MNLNVTEIKALSYTQQNKLTLLFLGAFPRKFHLKTFCKHFPCSDSKAGSKAHLWVVLVAVSSQSAWWFGDIPRKRPLDCHSGGNDR